MYAFEKIFRNDGKRGEEEKGERRRKFESFFVLVSAFDLLSLVRGRFVILDDISRSQSQLGKCEERRTERGELVVETKNLGRV